MIAGAGVTVNAYVSVCIPEASRPVSIRICVPAAAVGHAFSAAHRLQTTDLQALVAIMSAEGQGAGWHHHVIGHHGIASHGGAGADDGPVEDDASRSGE